MFTLGIVADDKQIINEIEKFGHNENYECKFIEEKEQVDNLKGLLIQMEAQADLAKVVDWLIACKVNPRLFVWIYSKVSLDYEKEILLQLGANGIITEEDGLFTLSFLIKNTFNRFSNGEVEEIPQIATTFLNKVNQSIVIDGVEKELTRKEFQLIYHLHKNRNMTVNYEELTKQLWPDKQYCDNYRLSNVMLHLREKLKESDGIDIRTVRSKGYMLRINA